MDEIGALLRQRGVGMTEELGFNNTYTLVMQRNRAIKLGVHRRTAWDPGQSSRPSQQGIGGLGHPGDDLVKVERIFLRRRLLDGSPVVFQNLARISVAVRHRRGLSKVLGRQPLAGWFCVSSMREPECL
ncbi:MAG: hypothetical protein WB586_13240 [Chthoniobacterales bacterium]